MPSRGVGRSRIMRRTGKTIEYCKIIQNNTKINSYKQQEILLEISQSFQKNNAPYHRANVVQKWFEDNTLKRMSWPGQSSYLNSIKNQKYKIDHDI
ncbi:hypothetical protein TNCV_5037211 [Trichonephila clavipes]|nr:hypothetical protein TNCV_5037211 [Trichonephila clavipes]